MFKLSTIKLTTLFVEFPDNQSDLENIKTIMTILQHIEQFQSTSINTEKWPYIKGTAWFFYCCNFFHLVSYSFQSFHFCRFDNYCSKSPNVLKDHTTMYTVYSITLGESSHIAKRRITLGESSHIAKRRITLCRSHKHCIVWLGSIVWSIIFWLILIFGVLTPLSTIFQLYHGDQF